METYSRLSDGNDYPEKDCEKHPTRTWEWDGYGWICVSCIMEKKEAK